MYEPDAPPASDATSTQWAPYDHTAFIPPVDDFDPQPVGVSEPPAGRQYGMYRQDPTWQHASLAGTEGMQVNLAGLLQGLGAIAVATALGYGLTGNVKVAAGAGLGMAGVLQLPSLLKAEFFRAMIGGLMIGGAYWILRDELHGFDSGGARANFDGDWDDDEFEENGEGYDNDEDDDDAEGDYEENDEDDEDDDEDDDDDDDDDDEEREREHEVSSGPSPSSPWMRQH